MLIMRKGTKHTAATRDLLREKAKKRPARPHTPETRAKIAAANVGRHALISETIQTIAEVKRVLADAKAEDAQAVAK